MTSSTRPAVPARPVRPNWTGVYVCLPVEWQNLCSRYFIEFLGCWFTTWLAISNKFATLVKCHKDTLKLISHVSLSHIQCNNKSAEQSSIFMKDSHLENTFELLWGVELNPQTPVHSWAHSPAKLSSRPKRRLNSWAPDLLPTVELFAECKQTPKRAF